MSYEDKLQEISGPDIFWKKVIDEFIQGAFSDKDEGIDKVMLLRDTNEDLFNEFTKRLLDKNVDFEEVKEEFLGDIKDSPLDVDSFEDRLKVVSGPDIFWYKMFDEFIRKTYTEYEEGLIALEKLNAEDSEKLNEFSKELLKRKDDYMGVKMEFFEGIKKPESEDTETVEESAEPVEEKEEVLEERTEEDPKPQNDDDLVKVAARMAAVANLRLHAEKLSIPVVKGFEINNANSNSPSLILSYTNGKGLTESVVSDGPLRPGESLDTRIDLILKNVVQYMKQYDERNSEKNIVFWKDYSGVFDFKVFFQDMVFDGKYTRQVNALFLEPTFNDVYQLSLTAGPFKYDPEEFTIGEIDDDDKLINVLKNIMDMLMKEFKYR